MLLSSADFGTSPRGEPVELYTLRNRGGMEARIATYGGVVTHLWVPESSGRLIDVVLGYDTLAGYLDNRAYFGALIGRYANRIANGRFGLRGRSYRVGINDGLHSLHGGPNGFHNALWRVTEAQGSPQRSTLTLSRLSRDGEGGYPGTLSVSASYTVTEQNELRLDFRATTDQDTVVNLTQHSYFNLSGHGNVQGHLVQINGNEFLPVDNDLIPLDEQRPVDHTPFDFRRLACIGPRLLIADEQLARGRGFDHCWVIADQSGQLSLQATLFEPTTGIMLDVWSNQPGLQFYTGNMLDGSLTGKNGRRYTARSGLCLEPQHFPNAPNNPSFPSATLAPGQIYAYTIIYRFATKTRTEADAIIESLTQTSTAPSYPRER